MAKKLNFKVQLNQKTDDASTGKNVLSCIISLDQSERSLLEDLKQAISNETTGSELAEKDFDMFFQDSENEWVRIRSNDSLRGLLEEMNRKMFKVRACFNASKKEERGKFDILYLSNI